MKNTGILTPEPECETCAKSCESTINHTTLVVSYLPRGEESNTKKLLDEFIANANNTDIDILDLTATPPDFLMPDTLGSILKRNYGGQELSDEEEKGIAAMDGMTHQIMAADIVVLATPMYNFSLPAPVKAYFDAILQKGMTWDIGKGGYIGLMKGKKALVLMSTGGVYEGAFASYDHGVSLARILFELMGYDVKDVSLSGTNRSSINLPESITKAQAEVREITIEMFK